VRDHSGCVGLTYLCELSLFRLKTRSQFQAVLAGGTLARTTHFALHGCDLIQATPESAQPALFPSTGVWMGAMVPKRWAKRAVTRNAIKRQIYSLSAELELQFAEKAHVVRLRSGFSKSDFVSASSDALKQGVRAELLRLFGRQHDLPNRKPAQAPISP
jgi:ribonuclease P protein component